ncbi:MAG: hypothetical protein ACT6FD_01705 [Methanosarcinaceae archaeon]
MSSDMLVNCRIGIKDILLAFAGATLTSLLSSNLHQKTMNK